MKTKLFWPLASLLFLISCQDDLTADLQPTESRDTYAKTELQTLPSIKINNSGDVKSTSPIGNYPIDLSNPPRSVKINGTYHSDFKYWFDTNVATKIPYNIKNDISDKDGWEVIYNTIREYNPSTYQGTTDFPFVGLYNRYRGVFRFFYYHPFNSQGNDIVGILGLASNNTSKIFNHPTNGESYPNSQGQKYISTMGTALSSNLLNVSNGLSANTWYCFDFDVSCYDPNIAPGGLVFAINSIQRSDLKLSGEISGDIAGSITGNSSSSGSFLSIGNLFTKKDDTTNTTDVNFEINTGNADILGTVLNKKADASSAGINLKGLFKDVVKDGVGALKKGVSSFMSSGISGLFSSLSSSLFGATSSNIQQVKLQAKLDLVANGTITSTNSYIFDLEMPNKRIGIINLSSTPTVKARESVRFNTGHMHGDRDNPESYMCTHLLEAINYNIIVNQDIANEVDIYTTTDVLYINKSPIVNITPNMDDRAVEFIWGKQISPYSTAQIVGLDEGTEIWNTNIVAMPHNIPDKEAYKNYIYGRKNFIISKPLNKIYLKVNYRIVPRNGSETFFLQKIYKVNTIENNTINPFPSNWETIINNSGSGSGGMV